jgi:hypothetical protein
MGSPDVIDGIFEVMPGSAEERARSTPLLVAMSDVDLRAARADLAALVERGRGIIGAADSAQMAVANASARSVLAQTSDARARLAAIQSRIEAKQAARRGLVDPALLETSATLPAPAVPTRKVPLALRVEELANRATHHVVDWLRGFPFRFPTPQRMETALTPRLVGLSQSRQGIRAAAFAEFAPSGFPILLSNAPVLDPTTMIGALARMEQLVSRISPDVLVAVNEEGLAICRLLADDLRLKAQIVTIYGAGDRLSWDASTGHHAKASVCVIGHVAWTGETLACAANLARSRFETEQVTSLVLASTFRAVNHIRAGGDFGFHCLVPHPRVDLPINARSIRISNNAFAFAPAAAADAELVISREQLHEVRERVAAQFG